MKSVLHKFSRSILLLIKVLVLAILLMTFIVVWKTMYEQVSYFRQGNYVVVLSYAITMFAFMSVYGGFKVGVLKISEIIYSNALALIITNAIIYLQFSLITFALLPVLGMMLMTLIQIFFISIFGYIGHRTYILLNPAKDTVIVCRDIESSMQLVYKINQVKDKYKIRQLVLESDGLQSIKKTIDKNNSVLLCDIDQNMKKEIIEYCYSCSKRLYIVPSVTDILLNRANQMSIFDTPLLTFGSKGLNVEQAILKRSIDILFSLITILATSPIMLITAIAIKLYDREPILFKQDRLTKGGKVFRLYKFRSMVIDAEEDGIARLATKNDSRITPIGKFIRKTRIDELPQLFNILLGDMSIVGPRPERPEIAQAYMKHMPQFNYRLKVKAGLTGYAQVKGTYNTTPEDKLNLDLLYIENYSVMLDLTLMLMTLKIIFMAESTSGIETGQVLPSIQSEKEKHSAEYKHISM